MMEYMGKFSASHTPDQQAALIWKIENDFRRAALSARASKDEYVTFALRFYTRNRYSLEDVMEQHRAHKLAAMRRVAAAAAPFEQMAHA